MNRSPCASVGFGRDRARLCRPRRSRFFAAPVSVSFPAGRAEDSARARADLLAEGQSVHAREGRTRLAALLRQAALGRRHRRRAPAATTRSSPSPTARPFSKGIRGQLGGRSAPTVINRAYSLDQFWDGRAKTLEEQAKGPIANPIEMGHTHEACAECIARHRRATASGSRRCSAPRRSPSTTSPRRSPRSSGRCSPATRAYDKFKAGDKKALTESQQRGMEVFFSNNARCDSCHEGVNFTNGKYANVGIGMDKPMPDLGPLRRDQAGGGQGGVQDADPARHRPHRPVHARRQPEDAGGSRRALQQGRASRTAWLHQDVRPLNLKEQDKKDLVEFLKALSGEGWQGIKAPEKLPE